MKRSIFILFALFSLLCRSELIKSALCAHNISYAEMKHSDYTAADYIQDGLIAMWDGIENAGYGVHDPNTTIWYDLIGQNHLTMYDTALCEDKCALQPNVAPTAYRENAKIEWVFAEVVCDWSMFAGTSNSGLMFSMGNYISDDGPFIFGNWADWYNSGRTKYFIQFRPMARATYCTTVESLVTDVKMLAGTISIDKGNQLMWKNSVPLEMLSKGIAYLYNTQNIIFIGSNHMNGERGFKGRFYNVRIYGRILSQEEIEYNYMIDKQRFGL